MCRYIMLIRKRSVQQYKRGSSNLAKCQNSEKWIYFSWRRWSKVEGGGIKKRRRRGEGEQNKRSMNGRGSFATGWRSCRRKLAIGEARWNTLAVWFMVDVPSYRSANSGNRGEERSEVEGKRKRVSEMNRWTETPACLVLNQCSLLFSGYA